jgi:BON domain
MVQKVKRGSKQPESARQSSWIRLHPSIGTSTFPDYPDEPLRRGSSRGAVPNGNPWKPENDDERPGPRWTQPTDPAKGYTDPALRETDPDLENRPDREDGLRAEPTESPSTGRDVEAPPEMPVRVAHIGTVSSSKDESLADEIGERLAASKILEGESVGVDVHAGRVTLTGIVASAQARSEAEQIASSVRGVAEVENRIRLEARRT